MLRNFAQFRKFPAIVNVVVRNNQTNSTTKMSNNLRFDGRVVVVTGAGAGLGREYALLFASRGAKVIVNDLGGNFHGEGQSRQADIVVKEIKAAGGEATADYNSVTDGAKIIETAVKAYGKVDVLVNNAGILRDKSFHNMSDADWNLVYDVHVRGAYATTRAAWGLFRKQKYGRVIMTSSNSGIYGNFGQANYSMAKLGLVGLANTLAIEGAKYNIHTNVIAPTAASRMTEGILPEELFSQLKPKLIAPVVVYMCHESCPDNGTIVDSAAGWAAKVHMVRGKGAILRASLDADVTIENVRDAWSKVTDMSKAERCESIAEASGGLMTVIETLESTKGNTGSSSNVISDNFTYNYKDLILYALAVGANVRDASDLKFLYENADGFAPIPTFFIQPSLLLQMSSDLVTGAIKHKEVDLSQVFHGEQYLEVLSPLPTEGTLRTDATVIDVQDKKSGAVVVCDSKTFDENGNALVRSQVSVFIVGAGGFGGKGSPASDVIPIVPTPDRAPDATLEVKTGVNQAAIFRLSGDLNPMHIDPSFSMLAGHKIPILHGLGTLGLSVTAILKQYAGNKPELFKAVKARFAKPVIPGQTLKVSTWKNGDRVHFKSTIVETGVDVITGAYVDLKSSVTANRTSGGKLQSDAIFEGMQAKVDANLEAAKRINGVFLYKITDGGKVAKEWTCDLKEGKVYAGPPKGKADTTLTVADGDFVDIALGKLNPQQAFMKGKLKITGNIMLTQKLAPLLKNDAKL